MNFFGMFFLNTATQIAKKKINLSCVLSVVAMIAYMTHGVDKLIGLPSAKHF